MNFLFDCKNTPKQYGHIDSLMTLGNHTACFLQQSILPVFLFS